MHSFDSIEPGWDVYGSDDRQIGTVHVAGDDYLEVEKGTFFIKDLYIPRSAVADVDSGDRRVTLNVTRDAVGEMGWTEPPLRGVMAGAHGRETWGQGTIDEGSSSDERAFAIDHEAPGGLQAERDRELAGGPVERMSAPRIEESVDTYSAGQVPVERVDEETLEVWSEPGTVDAGDAGTVDAGTVDESEFRNPGTGE